MHPLINLLEFWTYGFMPEKWILSDTLCYNCEIYMIDSDRRPVSKRRPFLKSASTDVIYLKSQSPWILDLWIYAWNFEVFAFIWYNMQCRWCTNLTIINHVTTDFRSERYVDLISINRPQIWEFGKEAVKSDCDLRYMTSQMNAKTSKFQA
jgi:hypothetical protein